MYNIHDCMRLGNRYIITLYYNDFPKLTGHVTCTKGNDSHLFSTLNRTVPQSTARAPRAPSRESAPTLILQPEKGKSYGRVQRSVYDVRILVY